MDSWPLNSSILEIKTRAFHVSNFPPHLGKVQISHPLGMDDGERSVGYPGGGGWGDELIGALVDFGYAPIDYHVIEISSS